MGQKKARRSVFGGLTNAQWTRRLTSLLLMGFSALMGVLGMLISSVAFGHSGQGHYDRRCDRLLESQQETLQAAVYNINIWGPPEESNGYGQVTVVKNGSVTEESGDSRRRPEMDSPRPEPTLQEIIPTERDKQEVPVPVVVPNTDEKTPPSPPEKKKTYLN